MIKHENGEIISEGSNHSEIRKIFDENPGAGLIINGDGWMISNGPDHSAIVEEWERLTATGWTVECEYRSNVDGFVVYPWRQTSASGPGTFSWLEYRIRITGRGGKEKPPKFAENPVDKLDMAPGKIEPVPEAQASNAPGDDCFVNVTPGDFDPVTKPEGYNMGEIECIDAMRSALNAAEFRGGCKMQAMQYVWRERYKGGDQDIEKAIWWLRMAIGDDPRDYR